LYRALVIAEQTMEIKQLCSELARCGIACTVADSLSSKLDKIALQPPDILLVDLDTQPSPAQTELLLNELHRLRTAHQIPAIALLASAQLEHLHSNLTIDDFIVKPWHLAELVARIKRAVASAHPRRASEKEVIRYNSLVIDISRCEVKLNGRALALTFKEYQLLKFLAMNKGKVFTREALLTAVWGYNYYGGDRTVDVHIRRLRSKLGDYSGNYIQTVRNIGYRFNAGELPETPQNGDRCRSL
jgi:DNA-binding response OmpR family regulator